jgi:uncharacterized protein YacL
MNRTLLPIRIVFVLLCAGGGYLVSLAEPDWSDRGLLATCMGALLGIFLVLIDILLKGFSLRGLSAITFGLVVGVVISSLIGSSPLFDGADSQIKAIMRIALFLASTYLCTVIALRGKDEFNLVIPYVRFVPHEVDVPLVVVDTSALIDGRIARICESGFVPGAIVIPQFVLNELQTVADAADSLRRARGKRGLDTLGALRKVKNLDLRIHQSEAKKGEVDAKLVFLASAMKAKLLSTDLNLAKMAEFHGVAVLHPGELAKAIQPNFEVGEVLELDLVKVGKDEGQALAYLPDGSLVVVNEGRAYVGSRASVEILSVVPSGSGRILFARLAGREGGDVIA